MYRGVEGAAGAAPPPALSALTLGEEAKAPEREEKLVGIITRWHCDRKDGGKGG